MRRNSGFSLIELLVAVTITIAIVGVSLDALNQGQRASEAISLMSNMTENLRAGMDQMQHDLVLAGSGIPTGGISIPNGSGVPINQPSPTGDAYTFAVGSTAISAVTPGFGLGPLISGTVNSDMVTIIYADNQTFPPDTVAAPEGLPLSGNIINDPGAVAPDTPCNGSINSTGTSVIFDATCVVFNAGNGAIGTGDLIMFSNAQGNTLEYVTGVTGQVMAFVKGDPYGLNGRTDPAGTIYQLQSASAPNPVTYPPTTATRIWMVTYYLDNTNPSGPRLMRQVNFFTPEPVAESIEALWITYNFVNGTACGATCSNQPIPPAGMTANQMMSANLFLGARSDKAFSWTKQTFRNNLVAQISLRGLAFTNQFQ
ncbi:MAG: prepilin-type N-terminal cleavage/methylation domain-containing protein [Candidatus Acidiferrales bacterium]